MHEKVFLEIAMILGFASVLGFVGQKLRQPLLIMFLATGILAGPSGLGVIQSYQKIELLANMGIAILLFIVGLKLDLQLIRTTGPVALATGVGQIVFTAAIGFLIALAYKMPILSAAYVAVALTFSSTIIIVKLLSDKREIDALHGQIAIGFLIVQDIAAILALVALTTFGGQKGAAASASPYLTSLAIAGKGIGLLAVIGLLMRFVLPSLVKRLAHSQEMLTLFAITWAVALGAISDKLGFSKEVGAFLAGISLASTSYRDAISARLTTLRDFLLLFFFIDLGARLNWSMVGDQIGASFVFSIFVLVGNPLIVLVIMGWMGYRRRTSFLAGLAVAQISEFSLIVAALGLNLGHISKQTMGLITLVGVVTIFASTYMILYSAQLYQFLSKPLRLFERKHPYREALDDTVKEMPKVDVILVGLGNYGGALAEYLLRRKKSLIGVDFDPISLKRWQERGIPAIYGDMSDPEIHEQLPLHQANWVVSTVRSEEINLALIHLLRNNGYKGKIALTAINQREFERFRKEGAQVIFRPFADAAEQAADALAYAMDALPSAVTWPITFTELRVRSEAAIVGKTLEHLPLQEELGASVLAISRAGRPHYNPPPDFPIYPGDRLVLVGSPKALREAENRLHQIEQREEDDLPATDCFEIAEIPVLADSSLANQSIAESHIRPNYGVTIIGIKRGDESITEIHPQDHILPNDTLIVVGAAKRIQSLRERALRDAKSLSL